MTVCTQVISALPEKRTEIEQSLMTCRQYLEDLEELAVWCTSTRDYLQAVQDGSHLGSGAADGSDATATTKVCASLDGACYMGVA